MNKLIKEKLEWYAIGLRKNLISTTISLLGITVLLYIFFFQPDGRDSKLEELNGRTTCIVSYFEPKEMIAQTSIGNHSSTLGYTIKYNYEVNGKTYYSTEYLKESQLNRKSLIAIRKNVNNKKYRVKIKYAFHDPNISMIDREN